MRTFAGRGLLLCALALGGCYKATFFRDPSVIRGAEHDRWSHFFLCGLVGEETLDVHEFCPDGRIAEVETQANFWNGLVRLVTIGIYAPRAVYVTCAASSRSQLQSQLSLAAAEPALARSCRSTGTCKEGLSPRGSSATARNKRRS